MFVGVSVVVNGSQYFGAEVERFEMVQLNLFQMTEDAMLVDAVGSDVCAPRIVRRAAEITDDVTNGFDFG